MHRFRAIMEVEDFLTPREEAELDLRYELQRRRVHCRCQHPECEDCCPDNEKEEDDE